MLLFTGQDPRILTESGDLHPLRPTLANPQPERERLRHLIIGSPEGVRSTIHTLYALNYADPITWSRLIAIPATGIVITPQEGEVLSYLLRWRQPG